MTDEEKYHQSLIEVVLASRTELHAKCVACNEDASFDHPKYYCKKHWSEWWANCFADDKKQEVIEEITNFLER